MKTRSIEELQQLATFAGGHGRWYVEHILRPELVASDMALRSLDGSQLTRMQGRAALLADLIAEIEGARGKVDKHQATALRRPA